MPEQPSVTVTLKDIYDEVRKVQEKVNEIAPQIQHIVDHETRIRILERWKYALPSSVILALVSLAVAILETKP